MTRIQKTHVLVFKFALALGGGERFTTTLSRGLMSRGYQVRVFSNFLPLLKTLRTQGIAARWFWWGAEAGSRRGVIGYYLLLPYSIACFTYLLRCHRVRGAKNVIILQNLNEKLIATKIAKRLGYRVLWVEHLSPTPWLEHSWLKEQYRKRLSDADRIIAISQHVRDEFVTHIGIQPECVEVIYNGVDVTAFSQQRAISIAQLKKDLGIPEQAVIIGSIGRLHKEKGLDVLLHASARCMRENRNMYMVMVGDGSERKALEKLAATEGIADRVVFTGYQQNISSYLQIFHIFVLPSRVRESFGIVLLEAMAASKPVIASNIGGVSEIVQDGATGYLVSPGSEEELYEKLTQLIQNKKRRILMGEEGYQRVREKFSEESMIDVFEKII